MERALDDAAKRALDPPAPPLSGIPAMVQGDIAAAWYASVEEYLREGSRADI
jgi:hypothetical protein